MAGLAAVAMFAANDHVAEDDAHPDAGAEGEEDEAGQSAAGPHPELAVGGGVGVVLEGHRQAAVLADPVADGKIVPAGQVNRAGDDAGGEVHGAGGAEAHPGDGLGL